MLILNKTAKVAAACLLIACSALLLKKRRERRWWVKLWLSRKRGNINLPGGFKHSSDLKCYQNFLRMDEATFNKLLEKIRPRIMKQSNYWECISARDKLIITLRYLATGESYRSLMYNYRISESTISLFVPVVRKSNL
ncbi:hypothetical protein NQ314_013175 [Rhamnusium bicolor]|uniref:Transposase n=1 Tax=Rhamnusium bicolor TaxID=1586634 RepID=A0AAV8X7D5_9CUCU|nr:hypothetical protein NQ314_013175 [Rhamnusium bicolor]